MSMSRASLCSVQVNVAPFLVHSSCLKTFIEWMSEWVNELLNDWDNVTSILRVNIGKEMRSKSDFCSKKAKASRKRETEGKQSGIFSLTLEEIDHFRRGRRWKEDQGLCFWRFAHSLLVLKVNFSTWTSGFISGGLSAFKSGTEAIATSADIQADYVNDILARAKLYKKHGF